MTSGRHRVSGRPHRDAYGHVRAPELPRRLRDLLWVVYAITVLLAWRKVLAVPDGRGDVTGLFVATVYGAAGLLLLLTGWLQEHERKR